MTDQQVFPQPELVRLSEYDDAKLSTAVGISLRQYYAGLALQGCCADGTRSGTHKDYAKDAVRFADDLIAELAKGKES